MASNLISEILPGLVREVVEHDAAPRQLRRDDPDVVRERLEERLVNRSTAITSTDQRYIDGIVQGHAFLLMP